MASRKDEKDRLRQAREQAEAADRKQERKQLILGYIVAGLISAVVIAGIAVAITNGGGDSETGEGTVDGGNNNRVNFDFGGFVPNNLELDDRDSVTPPTNGDVTDLDTAAAAANCELLRDQEDEGNTHIAGDRVPDYKANPPTSGDHSPEYLADGAYLNKPNPLNYIHLLEHGRIEIQYSPDLPEEEQLELLGLYDEQRAGMGIFPNEDQPYLVAATAWTQTLGCDEYQGAATLDAIRAFRDEFLGQGPEQIPF